MQNRSLEFGAPNKRHTVNLWTEIKLQDRAWEKLGDQSFFENFLRPK